MSARTVMVLGTTSAAGKSWLATALCRWYARQGLRVAPFKAQNMSNNARVVAGPEGHVGEISSAQYFQALAARARPSVDMNPVLVKPEHDNQSQVVLRGQVEPALSRLPWLERGAKMWPAVRECLHGLMASHDVVVIEGAGSPAEINLRPSEIVNMRVAREAQAACLLVSDIDRGGSFAHLYGTHQLLLPEERALFKGFVLNRFRGDASLLAPGPQQLEALTGVPTVAVLPMWRGHGLPEEDGVFDDAPTGGPGAALDVAVLAYPRLSNLDEFQPLRALPQVRLRWVREAAELGAADWIILPGAKHTAGSLEWLRAQRLDAAIIAHARAGKPVLGICGGLQMLGEDIQDPHGIDGSAAGLGLLPLTTVFARDKWLGETRSRFAALAGPWSALSGVEFFGYEIHHGQTHVRPDATVCVALRNAAGEPLGWQCGPVLGLYSHGLFESPTVLRALFGAGVPTLDSVFDGLADFIDRHFAPGVLGRLIEKEGAKTS